MSNPIHVVARNRPDVVAAWDDDQVARRWLQGITTSRAAFA